MNIISIMALVGLLFLVPYALYIDYCRQGRSARGRFTKKNRTVKKQLFYSELRGELKSYDR